MTPLNYLDVNVSDGINLAYSIVAMSVVRKPTSMTMVFGEMRFSQISPSSFKIYE